MKHKTLSLILIVIPTICYVSTTYSTTAREVIPINSPDAGITNTVIEVDPVEERIIALTDVLSNFAPKYLKTRDDAYRHAEASVRAWQATGVDPTLLLAIAWVESRFSQNALSRRECRKGKCKRVTTDWSKITRPPNAFPTWYCGVTQIGGNISWSECQKLREDLTLNYVEGAKHLIEWKRQCKDFDCALRGYNGGYDREALKRGIAKISTSAAARWYAKEVLKTQKAIN